MKLHKRALALILAFITLFGGAFSFSSCGLGKDKSKIYIISEDEFKSTVKLDDDGNIKKLDLKKLEKADEENLITGKKYYAVVYADGKKISQGDLCFYSDVTVNTDEIYLGTKKDYKLESEFSYIENPGRGGYYARIMVKPSEYKKYGKTDNYYAVGFIAENADSESFHVKLSYYQGSYHGDVDTHKSILYKKQITSEASIKYLSYEDYMSGDYDGKLKDSIEAPIGEKIFAVIDYKLSAFNEIEETDTASVSISAKSTNPNDTTKLKLRVEEFPTADYSSTDTSATAEFRLKDGGEAGKTYRFIVSLISDGGIIYDISAEISAKQISFLNQKTASSKATVSPDIEAESKLEFTLSPDGTYYTVSGLGEERAEVIKIPSTYKDKPVKAIADNVFSNVSYITDVIFPETLETIGAGAFKNCTSLERIVIPLSVTVIGNDAFVGCSIADIYCEAKDVPSGWSDTWADPYAVVNWGYVK